MTISHIYVLPRKEFYGLEANLSLLKKRALLKRNNISVYLYTHLRLTSTVFQTPPNDKESKQQAYGNLSHQIIQQIHRILSCLTRNTSTYDTRKLLLANGKKQPYRPTDKTNNDHSEGSEKPERYADILFLACSPSPICLPIDWSSGLAC